MLVSSCIIPSNNSKPFSSSLKQMSNFKISHKIWHRNRIQKLPFILIISFYWGGRLQICFSYKKPVNPKVTGHFFFLCNYSITANNFPSGSWSACTILFPLVLLEVWRYQHQAEHRCYTDEIFQFPADGWPPQGTATKVRPGILRGQPEGGRHSFCTVQFFRENSLWPT